jgi:hypothetical protein
VAALAIADPPYLGRAALFYGDGPGRMNGGGTLGTTDGVQSPAAGRLYKADHHPDAAQWDDPCTHRALVDRLIAEFDGWAIAMVPDNLRHYLAWVPPDTRIAVWHDPQVMPTGRHPRRRWEPVLVAVPPGRRRVADLTGPAVGDVFTAGHDAARGDLGLRSFAGRKPLAWTRWVLAMLGWDAAVDTVADLFPGSGAVQRVLEQPPLALGWPEW